MRTSRIMTALALVCIIAAPAAAQDLPADVCVTVKAVRGTEPITSNSQLGAMLNRIAWTHRAQGIGLSRKTGGNRCPSPAGEIACDILQLRDGTAWDVLRAAEPGAPSTPQCGSAITITDPDRPWVAPVDPGGGEPVDPPPPPPSDAATVDLQRQQLAALLQIIAQLQQQNAALAQGLAEIKAAIAAGVRIRF